MCWIRTLSLSVFGVPRHVRSIDSVRHAAWLSSEATYRDAAASISDARTPSWISARLNAMQYPAWGGEAGEEEPEGFFDFD
jgi:hypothetical protein